MVGCMAVSSVRPCGYVFRGRRRLAFGFLVGVFASPWQSPANPLPPLCQWYPAARCRRFARTGQIHETAAYGLIGPGSNQTGAHAPGVVGPFYTDLQWRGLPPGSAEQRGAESQRLRSRSEVQLASAVQPPSTGSAMPFTNPLRAGSARKATAWAMSPGAAKRAIGTRSTMSASV